MERVSLLGIFAHPDDEFAISGLILKAISVGIDVNLVSVTKGEAGKVRNDKVKLLESMSIAQIREEEYLESCKTLGVSTYHFLNFIDGQSKDWDLSLATSKLVRLISQVNPTHIVSFDMKGGNGHPDHIATSIIARNACECIEGVGFIQLTMYPQRFISKKLWWLPKNLKNKLTNKVCVEDELMTLIYKLSKNELSSKLKLLKIYNSQFPDEKKRYYKQNMIVLKKFARYECYYEECGHVLANLRRSGWNFGNYANVRRN